MSKNHPHDNIYSILGKLEALQPATQEKHDATVKSIYESVEAQGSILKGLREVSSTEQRLAQQFAESEITCTPGKTVHRSTNAYGGTPKEKDHLSTLDKAGTNRIEKAMGIKFDHGQHNVVKVDEVTPPGMEKMVRKLKKEYPGEESKAYATAWSIYNKKHGKAEESREACAECSSMEEALSPEQSKRHDAKSKEAFIQICRSHGMSDEQIKRKLARWAKTPGQEHMKGMEEAVHVGKYGTEYYGTKDFTGDDEDTPKAKSTEKKGRGRPTKASTGEKTSQERMPWGGKPPKVDANPTKKWPKDKTTVHKISESMDIVGQRLVEGLNFKKMAEETHQSIDELMSELQKDITHYKTTGHCSEKLKDFLQVHSHSKKQMADEAAMETSVRGGIGHDLVTPAERLAPSQSKPGVMGTVKDVAKGASNWLRGKPETGPTYEEVDPLEEELNELAKLAGLKVADEGAGVMHFKKQQAEKSGKDSFKLGDKEFPVDESDMEEGNAFSGALAQAKAQHKDEFDVDGKEYQVKEADAPVVEPSIDPVNKPKQEYKTMRQSTMGPGEGDAGEKRMYPPHPIGDNGMTEPARKMPIKNGAVKEAFAAMEATLAAEYESIKKVSK